MEHLVNNSSIQRDDPILIYFAGHGSRLSAPKDWYPGIRKPRTVEVLCTYDFDSKDEHGRVSGISDRSMNAMLGELAAVGGDDDGRAVVDGGGVCEEGAAEGLGGREADEGGEDGGRYGEVGFGGGGGRGELGGG